VARVAEGQHGVVTLGQMEAMGLGGRAVVARVEAGRLHRVHQGVFAVGHPLLTSEGRFLAAVLAEGPGALLSHRSAAVLWGFSEYDEEAPIDVTAPHRRGRCRDGISAHRDERLDRGDRTRTSGVPCTTVPRTLLDLAAVLPPGELRRAVAEAESRRLVHPAAMRQLLRRSGRRRGVARLRLIVDELHPAIRRTRSETERDLLDLFRRQGLPVPEVNVRLPVDGKVYEPDFLWRRARLILEADSRRFHGTRSAEIADSRREQRLQVAGWLVTRCTWSQLEHEPGQIVATVRALLAQAPSVDGTKSDL
jgi:very-short-patch-repair endonuclease